MPLETSNSKYKHDISTECFAESSFWMLHMKPRFHSNSIVRNADKWIIHLFRWPTIFFCVSGNSESELRLWASKTVCFLSSDQCHFVLDDCASVVLWPCHGMMDISRRGSWGRDSSHKEPCVLQVSISGWSLAPEMSSFPQSGPQPFSSGGMSSGLSPGCCRTYYSSTELARWIYSASPLDEVADIYSSILGLPSLGQLSFYGTG